MSVAGFDIGDQASCIAVARKRGIDVLLNKESNRETPSVLTFGSKQRLMGTAAAGSVAVNPKNAVAQLKRLLGKKYTMPAVQKDLALFPFQVTQGPNDSILVSVDYMGERQQFTPEQLMAMLIVDLKQIAEQDGSPVTDCVVSVPTYFTIQERYAMLDATQIAGVNCLRLLNDTTATALAYGIYKTDLPETTPVNVVFVDVGYSALQVTIVSFKKGQLKVLSHGWDRDLGGRDFDEVLFNHFVTEFDKKHGLDIRSNKRASFRLRLAAEKLKKVLSSIPETMLNVESLANDMDVSGKMTRDEFEEMAKPILERVKLPLQKALDDAKLTKDDIASVEVVGSSSRVPALLALMREVFGKEPSRTLNSKECVARGAALCCAMLSPIFRVRDFQVIDSFPFGIQVQWEKDGSPVTQTLFERNGLIPSTKVLTVYRKDKFVMTASYTPDSPVPEGFNSVVGQWTIGPLPSSSVPEQGAKLKVQFSLNLHGVVSLDSVTQVEEEEYEETIKKPKAVEPAKDATGKKDEPMADAEAEPAAANGTADATPMDTDAVPSKAEAPEQEFEVVKKKRTKKLPVAVDAKTARFSTKELQDLFEKECQMALQDRVQEETSERKNALEAYIYSLRNKLSDTLAAYATDAERSDLLQRLEKAEDWLYDEGEDETKAVYSQKLEELLRLGSPIQSREQEGNKRGPAAEALTAAANHYISRATSNDAKTSHIPQEDKDKVVEEANKALSWLEDKQKAQASLRKTDDPVLVSSDIKKKQDTLSRFAEPLLSKPAPPPPKPEGKAEKPEPKDESMEPVGNEGGEPGTVEGEETAPEAAPTSQPMES